jgi:thioredoxin-like negative regulator of GroEL
MSAEPKPRLVFFYSGRSGRSRRVEAFIAQVLQRRHNHDSFVISRVDVEDRPDLVERFRVNAVPTVLVIDESRVRARVADPSGVRPLAEALAPWLH